MTIRQIKPQQRLNFANKLLEFVDTRDEVISAPTIPPPPGPLVLPPSLPIIPPDFEGPAFSNATTVPWRPFLRVQEQLWARIGGWRGDNPEKRPIAKTTTLVVDYLHEHPNDKEAEGLLGEAKKLARDCLTRKDDTNRDRFKPQIARSLQLVANIGDKILVDLDRNGKLSNGILLGFSEPMCFYGEPYMLYIRLECPRDELSVITYFISQEKWFQGYGGIAFVHTEASEDDGVMVDH